MEKALLILVGSVFAAFPAAAGATVTGGPGAKVDAVQGVEVSIVQEKAGYNSRGPHPENHVQKSDCAACFCKMSQVIMPFAGYSRQIRTVD